jgi:hypothetical protein
MTYIKPDSMMKNKIISKKGGVYFPKNDLVRITKHNRIMEETKVTKVDEEGFLPGKLIIKNQITDQIMIPFMFKAKN